VDTSVCQYRQSALIAGVGLDRPTTICRRCVTYPCVPIPRRELG